ncbi:MAG TPA: hypothetical protein VH913_14165 [Hyphomicrobiaceae bacterium]|jgi:hypothetical protein
MPRIQITDRAAAVAHHDTLAAAAIDEIVKHFGAEFEFRNPPAPTSDIRLHVFVAGNWLVLLPVGPATWVLDTINMTRIARIEPVRFSDRAVGLINALGWSFDAVTSAAREAVATAGEDDHSVPFAIPIEHAYFAVWRDGDGKGEIDLDESTHALRN